MAVVCYIRVLHALGGCLLGGAAETARGFLCCRHCAVGWGTRRVPLLVFFCCCVFVSPVYNVGCCSAWAAGLCPQGMGVHHRIPGVVPRVGIVSCPGGGFPLGQATDPRGVVAAPSGWPQAVQSPFWHCLVIHIITCMIGHHRFSRCLGCSLLGTSPVAGSSPPSIMLHDVLRGWLDSSGLSPTDGVQS